MRPHPRARGPFGFACLVLLALAGPVLHAAGQDVLKRHPNYPRYDLVSRERADAVKGGAPGILWKDEGKALEFSRDGKTCRYAIASRQLVPVAAGGTNLSAAKTNAPDSRTSRSRRRSQGRSDEPPPARGRQYTSAVSPDGGFKAFYKDRNVWLATRSTNTAGAAWTNEVAITTEGSEKTRIKLGSASWTYGEELDQITAIWWSSNSQKVAFYRFDESQVPDYYLALDQAARQTRLDIEPYPKAGGTNPVVDVQIYDVPSKKTVKVDVRSGKPSTDSVPGHYVYNVSWRADSTELLFHRTDRRQKVMELCAADANTGGVRVVLREEWMPSWTENSPPKRFLKDGRRFIWTSERSGWKNLYLYDLSGQLLATLTDDFFDVAGITRVDEQAGVVYYMARSGDNPLKHQLHRVSLDGTNNRRLTDPAYHHTVNIAPDCRHFTDVAQTHDIPPTTTLRDCEGRLVAELAKTDMAKFDKLGLRKVELFEFKAADDETTLYGLLHFPSSFSPRKRYPLLVDVYAGPATEGAREVFIPPNVITELGFLYATFDSRSAAGRGKRALDSIYRQLGVVEIDDQAAGVKALCRRPYLDGNRVGIFGTSYGGTASALCLFRYPDVFRAASASSAVTDFRNYDTIYTERYLGLPQDDSGAAYDRVRVMTYLNGLSGRLMVFYGTADDNVHPSSTMQLVKALQAAGKSFDLQVGPDQGHASMNRDRMLEFFLQNLR